MNCRHVEQRLSDYLEGLVSKRTAAAITTHLRDCPACRRLLDERRALQTELHGLAAQLPAGSPDLERRSVQRWLAQRGEQQTGRAPLRVNSTGVRTWRLLPAAGVTAAFLVLLGLALLRPQPHRTGERGVRVDGPLKHLPRKREMSESAKRKERQEMPAPLVVAAPSGSDLSRSSLISRYRDEEEPSPASESAGIRDKRRPHQALHHPGGDLSLLNQDPETAMRRWATLSPDEWAAIEARVRQHVRVKDDFVTIPFPRLAAADARQIAAAVEGYKREAAIVDARLAREVSVQQKATALSDLCDHLHVETGISLTAGNSVADEKVTVFCGKLPLRDVMRQLSRPFGYTWLRSGTPGAYRYELAQDLKSQLLEEELRNRDRNQALLALEKEIQRYRAYLSLSPDEALVRAKTAPAGAKELLDRLSGPAWGIIQMFARLSPQEIAVLRAGQRLRFREAPRPGEQLPASQDGVLPDDVARGVLQSLRERRLVKGETQQGVEGYEYTPDPTAPGALPPSAIPSCRGSVILSLDQSELGLSRLSGVSQVYTIGSNGQQFWMGGNSGEGAVGISPTVLKPDNAALNAHLSGDPDLRLKVTVVPGIRRELSGVSKDKPAESATPARAPSRVTSADVLEALHRATGMPIISDYYTRLYDARAITVRARPLFEALNQVADGMRLRWNREAGWLQFRSTSFYDDRLKEVPNRLLNRWVASRREHGKLTLDDLCEIAQLSDAQLDGSDMAEGARDHLGLAEWDLARSSKQRPHLRFLASLTPTQRQEAMSTSGLLFTRMSLAQQQQFMALGLGGGPLQSLNDLTGATLRVSYTQPGAFQWGEAGWCGFYTRWVIPLGPGPQDQRVPRPSIVEGTRDEALAAVQRVAPHLRKALRQAVHRADPRVDIDPSGFERQQIFPTQLDLWFIYVPGAANARPIYVVGRDMDGQCHYRQR